jgi:hypothetical protein
MAVSLQQLLKIAALANDSSTDEMTRAVAQLRLEEAFRRSPELFSKLQFKARPAAPEPPPEASGDDPAITRFLEPGRWHRSSKNPDNLVRRVGDDTLITVFRDRYHVGRWSWSLAREDAERPTYSSSSHADRRAAMRDVWQHVWRRA